MSGVNAAAYIRTPGIRVRQTEQTVSTNSDVMALATQGEPEGLLLIANRQTGGRGRRGRSFFSPEGTGIYMSMLLRPQLSAEEVMLITPLAAVAVSEAVDSVCRVSTGIKWVNDILLNGKKICGILTEASFGQTSRADAVVVGIGLNCIAPKGGFPTEIRDIAGAIYSEDCPDETLVSRLIAEIWDRFFTYYRQTPLSGFTAAYRNRQILIGKEVLVLRGEETLPAHVLDVDNRCGLRVRFADGGEETLRCGEVSIRPLL